MRSRSPVLAALRAAFPHSIPVLTGFGFLGLAYGIYMNVHGFSFIYPLMISLIVFGGSLQFVMVTLLLSSFAPVAAFLMALLIQARHLFYGLAMLERYRGLGWKRFFLIFGLCDETFSITCSTDAPEGIDKGWFMLWITWLDQFYWITASTLGGILGSVLPFDTNGLDFVMTAMFVVIFLNQWLKDKQHTPAWIGLGCSVLCLLIFGADSFIVPTMLCILLLLMLFRKPIEKGADLT